ncbi:hypothetical protein H1D32_05070 [Anaerobacillus sp. CMMVII]|nr:hypothetical protein [Anaerobacillus sp. CMMVII]
MEYTYIVTAILAILVWFMPKRMKRSDMLVIWIFVSYIEIVVDLFLGHLVGLYYFVGETQISPEALGLKLIMSPLFGIIFINFMPKKFLHFIPYWLVWVIISTVFEWTTVLSGYLTYSEWKLWYSFLFYIVAIPVTRWFYYYVKADHP